MGRKKRAKCPVPGSCYLRTKTPGSLSKCFTKSDFTSQVILLHPSHERVRREVGVVLRLCHGYISSDLVSALHCVDMLWAGKEFLKCFESL